MVVKGCYWTVAPTPGTTTERVVGTSFDVMLGGKNCGDERGQLFFIIKQDGKTIASKYDITLNPGKTTTMISANVVQPARDVTITFIGGHAQGVAWIPDFTETAILRQKQAVVKCTQNFKIVDERGTGIWNAKIELTHDTTKTGYTDTFGRWSRELTKNVMYSFTISKPSYLDAFGSFPAGVDDPYRIVLKGEAIAPPRATATFVIWRDPATGGETVEVHPYILVVPLEKNPVVMTIANVHDTPISVDVWADFGDVRIPPQTTPLVEPNKECVFDYIFTVPDLPPGSYPTTFYIGKYDTHVYDSFTQPVIRVVKKIVEATFLDLAPPKVVYRGQKAQCDLVLDVKNIIGGNNEVCDVWLVRDTEEITNAIKGEGITIVDDRIFPLMEERLMGITKTPPLTAGTQYALTHEFEIPFDMPLGKNSFKIYFGKWGEYFLLGDIFSGDYYTVDVQKSSFILWMHNNDISLDNVINIVPAYLGRRDLGFTPTLDNLINVVRLYKKE